SNILDYLELSDDYSMVEVRSGKAMLGKTLIDLDIRAKFGCNVVAIRHGKEMNVSPSADYQITEDDVLIVIGADKDISKFERHRSEEHTSELQSRFDLVCRLLLEKKNKKTNILDRTTDA